MQEEKERQDKRRTSYRSTINFFFTSSQFYNLEKEKAEIHFFAFVMAFFVSFAAVLSCGTTRNSSRIYYLSSFVGVQLFFLVGEFRALKSRHVSKRKSLD